MLFLCIDCEAKIGISDDSLLGEIIGCPDCGLDYVISKDNVGNQFLQELVIEGEDWGE